jgi:hypothetical protein
VPKFELYNHNDEIFYELWTFAYFDRLCKLEKKGDEILKKSSPLKLLSQSQPNFAEMIVGWYYRIFYELWTFAYFDRLCKLEKRGMTF